MKKMTYGNKTSLDKAIKLALSNRLVLIQGPLGTGMYIRIGIFRPHGFVPTYYFFLIYPSIDVLIHPISN
jgi:hypothetical protein